MIKLKQIVFAILSTYLVGNAVLIIASYLRDALASTTHHELVQQDQESCCRDLCKTNIRPSNIANYSELVNKMPHLDSEYHKTFVRLGSDLHFDFNQCPQESLMLHRNESFSPKHLNCPTLFLVGARKGGTTSLYQYISKHPDFEGTRLDAGPKVGETFYFSWYYPTKSWESYISLFPSDGVMTGDASVGNLVSDLAPKRLYKTCGKQAKVVMLFRDPIKRFHSNFLMRAKLSSRHVGNETSVSTVVRLELDKFFGEVFKRTMNIKDLPAEWDKLVGLFGPSQNLVYEGLYYVHLLNWLCNFPAENILILKSEEFFKNSTKILDIVYQFLELKRLDPSTYHWITSATYNKGNHIISHYQQFTYSNKMSLLGVYRPFNNALLKLLQWENTGWTMDAL